MTSASDGSVWMGAVPSDWRVAAVKRLSRVSPSFSDGKPTAEELCTVVPMEALSEFGEVSTDSQEIYSEVTQGLNLFENGDVLFARITPCMENGKGAYIQTLPTRYAFGSTEFHVMRPSHHMDGKFLYYFTYNPTFRKWAEGNMYGAAGQQRVGTKFLKYTHVAIPPKSEQKLIARYLDATCLVLNRAIETIQKQRNVLDTLRVSIITPAVMSGVAAHREYHRVNSDWIQQLPRDWSLVSLKRVSETQTGITLGKTYEGDLVERPYLRAANVQDGHFDLDRITTIELPRELTSRYELRVGDVLVTEGGDLDKLGRGFVWEGQIADCLHQNHVFAVRTNRRLLIPEFLAYLTSSRFGRDYFEATGKRTTNLASTNSTKLGLLPVPLPPVPEQEDIVKHLNTELEKAKQIESTLSFQIDKLVAYRKSLIHECVTGKRRIGREDLEKVEAHV